MTTKCFSNVCFAIRERFTLNTIYDIGAHKGFWSQEHSRILVTPKFHMFEANPDLKDPQNGHTWHSVPLSRTTENRSFYARNGTGDSFYREQSIYYNEAIQPITLQTQTLDFYTKSNDIPAPDVIKIDTQGSELDILEGAVRSLVSCKVLLIEAPVLSYNKGAPRFDDYIDKVIAIGFVPIGVEEIHVIDGTLIQIDLVCVKKEIHEDLFAKHKFLDDKLFKSKNSASVLVL